LHNRIIQVLAVLAAVAATPQCGARVLTVGPGGMFTLPSQAARVARPGDRIVVAPGNYADCAVLAADDLTLEGHDPAGSSVMSGKICQDKAILITTGHSVTVRNMTLEGARSTEGNGAGIRSEGDELIVDRVRFLNNQNGILGGITAGGRILVSNSVFTGNGACIEACAHGIYAGHIALLRVENSRFFDTRAGHHIKSRALATEIIGCDIEDGPNGTASYEIDIPNGGSLLVRNTLLEKGPHTGNAKAAIEVGAEGALQPTPFIRLNNVTFRDDSSRSSRLLENFTSTQPELANTR
jgi:hypothetical protein